ncbi:unnamed protein product [Withania somnifera]
MKLLPASNCAVCGNVTAKQCSRCKIVRYCCEACQRSDWNSGHKFRCRDFHSSVKGNSEQSVSTLQRKKSFAISHVPFSGKTNILNRSKKVIFPYEEFLDFFDWNAQGFTPCGLINCGNSCFANVVLQCLTHTKPLVAYLLAKDHRSKCLLLTRMQMAFLDEFGGEADAPPSTRETTPIKHIFYGHLQSQVTCSKCNNLSTRVENMMDLTVEVHGESLEKCLDKFTAKECMDGENMYKCDRCNDYVKAWKRLKIQKAPNILIIALKRFQRGRLDKLNQRVTFPENLALYSYMTEERDDNDIFKLYAVIVHVNMLKTSDFGHYICYIKDFSGNWYRIDDDKVLDVKIDEVRSNEAYVLLYSRIVARPTSLYPLESLNKEDHDLVKAEGKQHSPLQPLECRKTTVSPAICADSGSLPIEYSSKIEVVRAKEELFSIANYEGGKEDSNIVELGASRKVLQELEDVGVSSAAEELEDVGVSSAAEATSCLRMLSSPCSSSAEAVTQTPEGHFLVSDIEEKTETCEENDESPLECTSEDSVAPTDGQYDGSASASSSSEISDDVEFDNSALLPEKARCEKNVHLMACTMS